MIAFTPTLTTHQLRRGPEVVDALVALPDLVLWQLHTGQPFSEALSRVQGELAQAVGAGECRLYHSRPGAYYADEVTGAHVVRPWRPAEPQRAMVAAVMNAELAALDGVPAVSYLAAPARPEVPELAGPAGAMEWVRQQWALAVDHRRLVGTKLRKPVPYAILEIDAHKLFGYPIAQPATVLQLVPADKHPVDGDSDQQRKPWSKAEMKAVQIWVESWHRRNPDKAGRGIHQAMERAWPIPGIDAARRPSMSRATARMLTDRLPTIHATPLAENRRGTPASVWDLATARR